MGTGLTSVDGVVRDADLEATLDSCACDVLQLLHSLFAHVFQLADMVLHIGDLHLASRPGSPGGHLMSGRHC